MVGVAAFLTRFVHAIGGGEKQMSRRDDDRYRDRRDYDRRDRDYDRRDRDYDRRDYDRRDYDRRDRDYDRRRDSRSRERDRRPDERRSAPPPAPAPAPAPAPDSRLGLQNATAGGKGRTKRKGLAKRDGPIWSTRTPPTTRRT